LRIVNILERFATSSIVQKLRRIHASSVLDESNNTVAIIGEAEAQKTLQIDRAAIS
jgi:hypothetical protein